MKLLRVVFCAAVFALTLGAVAQTSPGDLVVDVPFAFSANGEKLPAGHYMVSQKSDIIRIFNYQNVGLQVPTHPAFRTTSDGSKLVFHRYGNDYFLTAIWTTGSQSGKELFPSRAERELKAKRAEMEMAVVRPAQ
jgi:hypothetical protein